MARHATWERTIYIFLATAAAAAAATWPLLFFPYAIWNWILAKYLARGETCRILRFHDRDCSFNGDYCCNTERSSRNQDPEPECKLASALTPVEGIEVT